MFLAQSNIFCIQFASNNNIYKWYDAKVLHIILAWEWLLNFMCVLYGEYVWESATFISIHPHSTLNVYMQTVLVYLMLLTQWEFRFFSCCCFCLYGSFIAQMAKRYSYRIIFVWRTCRIFFLVWYFIAKIFSFYLKLNLFIDLAMQNFNKSDSIFVTTYS